MTDEQRERLKQIRRWRMMHVSANSDPYADLSRAFSEIDFVLSLLDSQAAARPIGWISCGLRHGHDRIVDIVFENADCAKAFIDGVDPVAGPIVAATTMHSLCMEKVKEMRDRFQQAADSSSLPNDLTASRDRAVANALTRLLGDLESLPLEQVEQEKR